MACVGQFYPKRLPNTPLVLAVCVASYALLSVALTAIGTLLERDAIALTRGGPGAGAPPRIALASRLPRFQDTYTLRIWPRQGGLLSVYSSGGGGSLLGLLRGSGGSGALPPQPDELRLSKSVAAYFTADGFMDHEAIVGDARRLLRQLAAAGGESAKDK